MIRFAAALSVAGVLAAAAGSSADAANHGAVCKAPVTSASIHGQQVDPSAPNYGEDLARKRARCG